jgi:ribosome biogenesis protein SSF1/2
MNNFAQAAKKTADGTEEHNANPIQKQLESLTTTVWQGIFPAITPSNTPLNSIKRILLLNRETPNRGDDNDAGQYVVNLRHYAITTKQSGVSKRARRFDSTEQRRRERRKDGAPLPNLGKLEDAADYLLGAEGEGADGYTTASDTEMDSENEVEVLETETQRVLSRKQRQREREAQEQQQQNGDAEKPEPKQARTHVEKRAVKLVELGPRMKLRLVKVEEGICDGKVMWNEFVTKSSQEEKELDLRWQRRRDEKESRRKIQRENVERKRQERAGKTGGGGGDEEGPEEMEYGSDFDIDDLDDDEALGQEGVGEDVNGDWEDDEG